MLSIFRMKLEARLFPESKPGRWQGRGCLRNRVLTIGIPTEKNGEELLLRTYLRA